VSSNRMTDRSWFARHPVKVAYDLIGCVLTVSRYGAEVAGRIVEAEAYAGPADPASHAVRRKVARATMGGPPGHIYTYLSYGIHTMMNIVAHEEGEIGGVLLRAIEPVHGLDLMSRRRNGVAFEQLGKGPGSLAQAMGIRLEDLNRDLLNSEELWLVHGEPSTEIHAGPRIGISRAVEVPWRFFESPSRFVSSHRRGRCLTRDEIPLLLPPPGMPIS
jgi:DNA-3-methyladenine glycosylase